MLRLGGRDMVIGRSSSFQQKIAVSERIIQLSSHFDASDGSILNAYIVISQLVGSKCYKNVLMGDLIGLQQGNCASLQIRFFCLILF